MASPIRSGRPSSHEIAGRAGLTRTAPTAMRGYRIRRGHRLPRCRRELALRSRTSAAARRNAVASPIGIALRRGQSHRLPPISVSAGAAGQGRGQSVQGILRWASSPGYLPDRSNQPAADERVISTTRLCGPASTNSRGVSAWHLQLQGAPGPLQLLAGVASVRIRARRFSAATVILSGFIGPRLTASSSCLRASMASLQPRTHRAS